MTMQAPATKRCCRCKRVKPLGEYHTRRAAIDGVQTYCKPCAREVARLQRRKRSDLILSAARVGEALAQFTAEAQRLTESLRAMHRSAERVHGELVAAGKRAEETCV